MLTNLIYSFGKTEDIPYGYNLTYTFGENRTASEPVGGIPPLFGLAGISWQNKNMFLEAYTRFAASQTRLSADDFDDPRIPAKGTPGWQTLNLRAEYEISGWLKLNAAVEKGKYSEKDLFNY